MLWFDRGSEIRFVPSLNLIKAHSTKTFTNYQWPELALFQIVMTTCLAIAKNCPHWLHTDKVRLLASFPAGDCSQNCAV